MVLLLLKNIPLSLVFVPRSMNRNIAPSLTYCCCLLVVLWISQDSTLRPAMLFLLKKVSMQWEIVTKTTSSCILLWLFPMLKLPLVPLVVLPIMDVPLLAFIPILCHLRQLQTLLCMLWTLLSQIMILILQRISLPLHPGCQAHTLTLHLLPLTPLRLLTLL